MSFETCHIRSVSDRWEAWAGNVKIAEGQRYGGGFFGVLARISQRAIEGSNDYDAQKYEEKKLTANLEFVSQLSLDGWEPLTSNEKGYIVSMKRQV